ncbi:right-handed parallel beta-helix repeat-containing protein [Methanobrevibacter sp.]|uniref:right-handed parallel beta-helix repeat-containing protein n=1 Tax=Methanobrevibacter sp. TaxID=66852 RepID=UPI0038642418
MKRTFLILLVLFCVATMAVSSVSAASDDMAIDDVAAINDNAINEVSLETDDSISDSIQAGVDDSDDKSLEPAPLKDGASTIYVSKTGDDSNDGLSEENAVATIAKGYELAGDGSTINIGAGTYDQSSSITIDKSITFNGAEGAIINKQTASTFSVSYDTPNTAVITIKGLTFTSADVGSSNPMINVLGPADVRVTDCTFRDCAGGRYGLVRFQSDSIGTVDNCVFKDLNGTTSANNNYISILGNSVVTVKNSNFTNIGSGTYLRAIIYLNSGTATGYINDCIFDGFDGNTNGVIDNRGTMTITGCTFTNMDLMYSNCKGIIYGSTTTATGSTTVKSCSFYNNKATYDIWVSAAPTTVENCAFDLPEGQYAIGNNKQAEVNANYNFYGTNDNPSVLLDNVTASNWVIMSASASADTVATDDSITITADFSKYTDGTTTGDVTGTMAEVPVKFTNADDTKGSLANEILYQDNKAIVTYTGIAEGADTITVTAASVSTTIPITVIGGSAPSGNVIYVKPDGNDENDGLSEATAVKTIAKAVELVNAAEGDQFTINIANGEYAEDAIDIPEAKSISFIGAEKDKVIIVSTATGNAKYFFSKNTGASNFVFKNLVLTGLDSGGGSLGIKVGGTGTVDIIDCTFKDIVAKAAVQTYTTGDVNIKGCTFKNILAPASACWGALYFSGNTNIVNIEDTLIDGISLNESAVGQYAYDWGAIYNYAGAAKVTLKNVNITNVNGPADAVIATRSGLDLINCNIYGNSIAKTGSDSYGYGLIHTTYEAANVNIVKSSFFNNTVYALIQATRGNIAVSYSAFYDNVPFEGAELMNINATSNYDKKVVANYNWWGSNDNPNTAMADASVDNWVIMNVEPASAENIEIGGTVPITVDFKHYTDGTTVSELADSIPELKVTATATTGSLDKAEAITENNQASFTYTAAAGGEDTVNIASGSATVPIAIAVNVPVPAHDVYVSKDGNDENDGSEESPVATIAKAIEIASSDAGTGNIFINAGTYTETGFTIAKDMVITGVGDVIIDANNETAKMFTISEGVASFALNNIAITKANQNYGAVLYNYYTADVVFNNVNITESYANGWSGSALIVSKGKLTIKDSKISNNGPISALIYNNGGTLIINNTAFENIAANTSTSCNGAIESTGNTVVVIENSNFTNIGAVRGAVYSGASDTGSLTIIGSNFENCTALLDGNNFGYGGAVHSQVALTIDKSTFKNSKSYRDGAAVYVTKAATITNSVFMGGDSQDGDTAEIYATGDLTLNNNILLKSSDDKYLVKTGSGTVDAKNNYWGSNDPSALVSGFTLENWVIMNVEPASAEGAVGQAVEFNVDFKHTKNAEGTISDLSGTLPQELTVYAESANGTIGESPITTTDLAGKIVFTPEFSGENIVNICTDANNKVPVTVIVAEPYTGPIYVSKDGSDTNDGSENTPVASIAKAVELAQAGSGKVIIKEGTYNENNITINSEIPIEITGEGNVVIDGTGLGTSSMFIIKTSQAVVIENIKFTNNKAKYGAAIDIEGSRNGLLEIDVTIDNCVFEKLEATSQGGAIYTTYTDGKLVINNSVFTKNNASSWAGALAVTYSAYEGALDLVINNTSFADNFGNNGGAAYLMANTITIENSNFTHNGAKYYPGALELYNCTATVDNCIFTDNNASKQSAAIKVEGVNNQRIANVVITNSIVENNVGLTEKAAAIYVDIATVEVSYSSLANEHVFETRTGTGYGGTYSQGVVVANNNWFGTNDPTTVVNGTNITIDKWVIMNVEANATDVIPGDEVKLTVDFNHVMTSAGEIEELTGGAIPKEAYTVTFAAENGTVTPETLTVNNGESGNAVFTASDYNAKVTATCAQATKDIIFVGEIPEPYTGIVYVSPDGSDRNNGSAEAPVASLAKAIAIATAETGSGQIVIKEGTYKGTDYLITKDLEIVGEGNVVIDGEGQGRLFYMNYGADVAKFSLSNVVLTGANHGYGAAVYSFAKETVLDNVTIINNPGAGDLITTYGNLTIKDSEVSGHNGGDVIQTSGDATIIINNTLFKDNEVTASTSDYGIVYVSSGKANVIIEDSKFYNNKARQGIVIGSSDANITVKGSEFINNTNTVSYGGAIRAQNKLDVTESVFINNKAYRDGGAIYIGFRGDATITRSEFINNSAGTTYNGDAIYNGNKATVNYCILLTNTTGKLIFNDGEDNVVNAQYNWWGTNDNPKSLTGSGTYEDDYYDEVDCAEVDVSNWIIMNVVADTSNVQTGAQVPIAVDFNHYLDSTTSEIKELDTKLAQELTVDFNSATGSLDKTAVETVGLVAQSTYTAAEGQNSISVKSSDAMVGIEFNAVTPKDTILNAEDEITVYFGEGVLNVSLTSEGAPVAGKTITVKVNDEISLTGITDESGIASIDLSSVPLGTYNAEISFAGDINYNPASATAKVTVKEAPKTAEDLQKLIDETPAGGVLNLSNMEFADISGINITKDITIVADNVTIASAGNGEPVFNIASNVSNVSISGVEFIANNGDVLVKATATNGTDDLSIVNPAIELTNNTVTPASDDVVPSSVTLFELESERAVLAPSNPINIKDNNLPEGAKAFDFEIAGLNDGNGINIPQGGNINTNGSSGGTTPKVATSIVAKAMKTTTVNTKINGKKAGKNYSITLKDSKGNVLAGKQVLISFNGKIYKRTTNAKGVATIKIALTKKGTYPVVVSFLGDEKYNGSFVVAKVKVNPQKVKLTVAKKTYKRSKKTKYLYATLKATNKKAIKGKKLVFIINKKKYTSKTNKKGVAKVKVKLSKRKTYKFTVKFLGDNTFKKISKKGKVKIK